VTRSVEHLIPGGLEPPASIPPDVFQLATETYVDCRRVDMGTLAGQLGISRSTLFRRAGRRDELLGEVLWYLTRVTLHEALEEAGERTGLDRVLFVIKAVMLTVSAEPYLRRFLEQEPEVALRILTSKHGPVQAGITEALERLLAEEQERGLILAVDRSALAYATVRIGEGFLYADVIADHEPDIDGALQLIASLVRAEAADPAAAPHPRSVR